MQQREGDKMSRSNRSNDTGEVDRNTASREGKQKSDSSADFGRNIRSSENLKEPANRGSDSGSSGYGSSGKSSGKFQESESHIKSNN